MKGRENGGKEEAVDGACNYIKGWFSYPSLEQPSYMWS